jgi:hypothetical protein
VKSIRGPDEFCGRLALADQRLICCDPLANQGTSWQCRYHRRGVVLLIER